MSSSPYRGSGIFSIDWSCERHRPGLLPPARSGGLLPVLLLAWSAAAAEPSPVAPLRTAGEAIAAVARVRQVVIGNLSLRGRQGPLLEFRDLRIRRRNGTGEAVELRIARIMDGRLPPRFTPLRLALELRPEERGAWALAGAVNFLLAAVSAGRAGLGLEGRFDGRELVGELRARGGFDFRPGALQPASLSPLLAGVRDVSGRLDLAIRIGFDGHLLELAELALADLSFSVDGARIRGLSGRLQFDRLFPPSTLPGQRLRVSRIEAGVPVEEVMLVGSLSEGTALRLRRLLFRLADGRFTAAPSTVDLARRRGELRLDGRDISLGRLAALAGIAGLEAEGRLDGELLLRFEGASVRIERGVLRATRPGTIRYRREDAGAAKDPRLALLLQTLKNFRYRELVARISGDLGGQLTVLLTIEGSNPDFHGGYPVRLNVTLQGPLGEILAAGIRSGELPARIEREIRGRLE